MIFFHNIFEKKAEKEKNKKIKWNPHLKIAQLEYSYSGVYLQIYKATENIDHDIKLLPLIGNVKKYLNVTLTFDLCDLISKNHM